MFLNFFLGSVLGIAVVGGGYFIFRYLRKRSVLAALGLSLFLIKIPREEMLSEGGREKDFRLEINKFEKLVSNLSSMRKTFGFEAAVPHIGEEIHFYLAVPKTMSEVAAKQVQGLWSGAVVEPANQDYNIFNPEGAVAVAYVLQKEDSVLPIRTYRELEADSFSSIVGGFSKVNEVGEGAAIQLLIRPGGQDVKKRVYDLVEHLKKGESWENLFGSGFGFKMISEALSPKKLEERQENKAMKVVDEEGVKALEAKISKPLFKVNLRLVTSAATPFQASDILDGFLAGLAQFGAPRRNEFKVAKPKNSKGLVYDFSFRNFENKQAMVLNSEEIASFFHLPSATTEAPKVKWLKSKEAPPPANLPATGILIGRTSFRGEYEPVYITEEDRRRHIYIIGQTGTGKSTLMTNMLIHDITRGFGVAMIDPHGDLVEEVLGQIPPERMEDVIYFDPADLDRPLGLNMLDYNFGRPEEKTFIVNEMQSIFNKLFSQETMGPMFEQYMRNALLLLMEDLPNEPATLIEVPRIFTDTEYRKRKLARIQNPVVIDFWEKEAIKAGGEASLANMTPYITSKFNNFISNDYMRPIIGQAKSAFNFRQAMDEGKIILINLSKGRIGDINAGLLGMVFTGKMLMAALSRVDIPDASKRRDFNLYIDEFQNFTTESISTILSEARKYRLSLTMAHQFIAQLTEKIRDAVFGNVGSQIVFRVGVQDAEFLLKQFEPTFDRSDLVNIDNFNAYAKILINGETSKPFNIKTLPVEKGNAEAAYKLKEYSRLKYGADRQEIEKEIYRRLRE
ncbi:MAG: type IV secretion system DNA-binding domain-containing protein [Candidatus Liptonbacteria bacterium]|nr:type IV secretion system DNA-binding domain-containing protein [Candidatus Liptonbacteria bacterium]